MGRLLCIIWADLHDHKGPYKKTELLNEKEPGLDDLGNSQPVQIAKGIKMRKFTVQKAYSDKKAKSLAG